MSGGFEFEGGRKSGFEKRGKEKTNSRTRLFPAHQRKKLEKKTLAPRNHAADGVSKYPIKGIWLSALYQAITTFVAEGIALVVDAVFHGIDYRKSWPLTRRGALTFLGWLLLIAFVGGSRICFDILLLFCPSVNAEGKAMMSFCNVPSLFDRI